MSDTGGAGVRAIRNFLPISESIGTSGQPIGEQFAAIRDAGYETLINLVPQDRSQVPDEAEVVTGFGLEYINIPVIWTRPTRENLLAFFEAMDARRDRKVYVHCEVNMRVSAFMYLYRVRRLGVDPDDAEIELHDIWVPSGLWKDFVTAETSGFAEENQAA